MTESFFIVTPAISIPWDELLFTAVRGSGPGGQNVNKVASKVLLRWNVMNSSSLPEEVRDRFVNANRNRINAEGQIVISSDESRDQPKNKELCLSKLADLIVQATKKPKIRRPTRPTKGSQQRRLQAKKKRSDLKKGRRPDFD